MTPNQTVVEMYNKGYGKRIWRFALLLENNCQMCYLEEETPDNSDVRDNLDYDPYILTQPEATLEMLRARQQKGHIETENKEAANQDYIPTVDLGQDANNNTAKIKEKVSDRMALG